MRFYLDLLLQSQVCFLECYMRKCCNNFWRLWYTQPSKYLKIFDYQRSGSCFSLWPCSLIFQQLRIFSPNKVTEPIIANCHSVMEMTVCLNESGYMTKMSIMPIYGKILSSFPEWLMTLKMICSSWDSYTIRFVQTVTLVWPYLFTQLSNSGPHGPVVSW